MLARVGLLAAVALIAPQMAFAQGIYGSPNTYQPPLLVPRSILQRQLLGQLAEVRKDALAQRATDGGTLTDQHRAALQARIDRLYASYRKKLRDNDPLSVGADGSPLG